MVVVAEDRCKTEGGSWIVAEYGHLSATSSSPSSSSISWPVLLTTVRFPSRS